MRGAFFGPHQQVIAIGGHGHAEAGRGGLQGLRVSPQARAIAFVQMNCADFGCADGKEAATGCKRAPKSQGDIAVPCNGLPQFPRVASAIVNKDNAWHEQVAALPHDKLIAAYGNRSSELQGILRACNRHKHGGSH